MLPKPPNADIVGRLQDAKARLVVVEDAIEDGDLPLAYRVACNIEGDLEVAIRELKEAA